MAGPLISVLACCVAISAAQIIFSDNKTPSTDPSPPAASPATSQGSRASGFSPSSPQQDSPGGAGQTRFFPGALDLLDPLGLFKCDRCTHFDQQCCSSQGSCCGNPHLVGPPIQTFPGQFPGQGGPGLHGGLGGFKQGFCPVLGGFQTGFNRFSTGACVTECQSDFHCPNIQKCCPVGCSTVCRTPQGGATVKPGVCRRDFGLGGLLGLRSAAAGPQAEDPSTAAAQRKQQRQEERRQDRQERRQQERLGRSRRDADDNPWSRRSRRSPLHREDRNDQKEARLNRHARVSGRVIRSADTVSRVSRQAQGGSQADQRFFLGSLGCRNECFNDFDCPGQLKCCSQGSNCQKCIHPLF